MLALLSVPTQARAQADACTNPVTGEPDTLVQCFADPCSVSTCEGDPDAACESNFCGGCHALYTNEAGDPADCEAPPDPDPDGCEWNVGEGWGPVGSAWLMVPIFGIARRRRRRR